MLGSISLDQYIIFVAIMEEGNMSAAAQKLHIGQPAVSMAIKKMEKQFSFPLFIRSKSGTLPTPEGKVLYQHIIKAFEHLLLGEKALLKMHHLEEGILRIGASDTLSAGFLLPFLQQYHQLYPKVHLQVTNRPTQETLVLLEKGEVDLGFINLPIEERKDLLITPCYQIHDVLIGSKEYQFLKKGLHPADLQQYPLLMLEPISITRKHINEYGLSQGIVFNPAFELGASGLLLEFARIHLGLAFVIKEFVEDQLSDDLFEIPLYPPIPPRHIGMIRPKNNPLSIAGTAFVNLIEKNILNKSL